MSKIKCCRYIWLELSKEGEKLLNTILFQLFVLLHKHGAKFVLLRGLDQTISSIVLQLQPVGLVECQFNSELVKLTVLWCHFSSVTAPIAPITKALSIHFASHLSDIECVWSEVLQSKSLDFTRSICKWYLKEITITLK